MKVWDVDGKPSRKYVYSHAKLRYDPMMNTWTWRGAKRKNRKSHHPSYIYIREEPKRARGIEVDMFFNFSPKYTYCDSPEPLFSKSYVLPASATGWQFNHYELGQEYLAHWKKGIISEINFAFNVRYNRNAKWRWWVYEGEDKVYVTDVQRFRKTEMKDMVYANSMEQLLGMIGEELYLQFHEQECGKRR